MQSYLKIEGFGIRNNVNNLNEEKTLKLFTRTNEVQQDTYLR